MSFDDYIENSPLNYGRNQQKALETLLGICHGVLADKSLNEREALFLSVWMDDNAQWLVDEASVQIHDFIDALLATSKISPGDLTQLSALLKSLINNYECSRAKDPAVAKTNELLGILQGVMADSIINTNEVLTIAAWLDQNPIAKTVFPGKPIAERLDKILEDDVITNEECEDLKQLIMGAGIADLEMLGSASMGVMMLAVDVIGNTDFTDKTVCMTGKFNSGTRSVLSSRLKRNGVETTSKVVLRTDYLVIGSTPNNDWIHSSYGRKIEEAIKLKQNGHSIKIITEQDILPFLVDAK